MLKSAFVSFLLVINFTGFIHAQNFNTDSLLLLLNKSPEDTGKVILFRNLGVSVAHQDPHKAIMYWKQGVVLGKKLNYDEGLARCYVNISAGYSFASQYDSSLIYIDTAIQYAHKVGDVNRLALVYLNRADAYIRIQNFTDAMKDCNLAMTYAEKAGNKDRLARIYHNISDIYSSQNQYKPAIEYLTKAVQLYNQLENLQMKGLATSDMAAIYRKMNDPVRAIAGYKEAIRIADSVKDYKNLSAYYTDLGNVHISLNKLTEAEPMLQRAMQYAKEPENILQQAVVNSLFCKLYLGQNKIPQAIEAGLASYNLAKQEEDLLWQQTSAGLLADAYRRINNNEKAYDFLKISNTLNDSLLKQQFNEETANLQTTFQVGQKDKEILLLNKNKELQERQILQQRFLIFTSAAIAILSLIGIWLFINRNRLRQQMKELELRNQIAADLHDEVGSSLSSIHMLSQIATQKEIAGAKQNEVLTKMSNNAKETMEKMGDIVWMIKPGESEGSNLKQRMERFAYEICSSRNIEALLELDELEKVKLKMEQRKNLYLIFKEALNNAVKYSGTEKIEIKVSAQNKQLTMLVKDYGKGFAAETISNGNGLDNMKHRAKELNGKLGIDSASDKGTIVQLVFSV